MQQKLKTIEELEFQSTFTDRLPGDQRQDNTPRQVAGAMFTFNKPTPSNKIPYLIAYSSDVCEMLDIDEEQVTRAEFANVFSGTQELPNVKYYSQNYGGHQFGVWAGQLGDGRVHNFGEIINKKGERYEVQLKGSGKTPYSRFADGRAVLRSSLREFIGSEALHHLGVPTSRALALIGTGRNEIRDFYYNGQAGEEPGAVVVRVAPTFIRIGSFQLPASRGEYENLKLLADYSIDNYFPSRKAQSDSTKTSNGNTDPDIINENKQDAQIKQRDYLGLLKDVVELNAKTVAQWQSFGFVHGVLNTDNTSILGLTIDYGPYGFLDTFDTAYTPNLDDLHGESRYCYKNQTEIIKWNVVQFANSLLLGRLIKKDDAQEVVYTFDEILMEEFRKLMVKKLGLVTYNRDFVQNLLQLMYEDEADLTNFFRSLNQISVKDEPLHIPQQTMDTIQKKDMSKERHFQWKMTLQSYRELLQQQDLEEGARIKIQNENNPMYIPRQHYLQAAIEKAELGDFTEVNNLLDVLKTPFTEQQGCEKYTQPPPKELIRPGIQCLTCSS